MPDAHRDALVEASACGVDVALVTGRSFHFTRPIAELLPLPLTLIVNNGALVKDRSGASVMRHMLDRDVARHVLAETHVHRESVAIMFDRPMGDDMRQMIYEHMDWSHPNSRGYFEKNKAFIAQSAVPLADTLTEDPIQVMFNGSVAPMRALVDALRATAAADRFTVAITEYEKRDFALVDITGAGCSKGTSLARWAASRGVTRDGVMAVGDNLNDVEMLDFAGTAVVMANASDALKSRGYDVTGSNDEEGLATAIRRLMPRRP